MFKKLICVEPVHRRPPKFEGDPDAKLALVRYHLRGMPWLTLNVIIHDEQQMHNHRWHFISMLLKGSYIEKWIDEKGEHHEKLRKAWRPSGLYFRNANHFHEVCAQNGEKVYTLFFRVLWPRVRKENQVIYEGRPMSTTRFLIKKGWTKEQLAYFWNSNVIRKQK